ncbi:hypothetical protein CN692_01555 [Bacillus sp. AFS002410]|uniref:UPF0738 family protein n=1 Tax=Bacillus sp. AFS002410 TaxID=2033481 RepID=UPI000BEFA3A8|nr:hypothetical protein [Bacillus sp. AFS002410]PEJ60802.1 hypothetical protein CN692_01555 [Bacillus sp. AFS002410]
MRKMLEINGTIINEDGLFLLLDQSKLNLEQCSEVGTMIADSDESSLLYIIEEKEEFVYVTVPFEYWSDLKKASDQNLNVFLKVAEENLALNNWNDELSYLVQNVEGNFNYGEEFVKQIQSVFLEEK